MTAILSPLAMRIATTWRLASTSFDALSPAYDLNPMPVDVKARVLSLAIDEANDTASLNVAFGMARQCGLKQPAAREIVQEVQAAVTQWRTCAAIHGLGARDMARMASAFEHEEAEGL